MAVCKGTDSLGTRLWFACDINGIPHRHRVRPLIREHYR